MPKNDLEWHVFQGTLYSLREQQERDRERIAALLRECDELANPWLCRQDDDSEDEELELAA